MAPSTQHPVTQAHRHLAIDTPLGKDVLLLTSFSGHEEMSRLFTYRLEMLHPEDPKNAAPFSAGNTFGPIEPDDIVGKRVAVRVLLPKEDPEEDDRFRFFNGFISRFTAGSLVREYRSYHAEMVPWPWFLTQASDCRIYSFRGELRVVLEAIFERFGFLRDRDYKLNLFQKHAWPPSAQKEDEAEFGYRVQYRETYFNFISRLMEEAGIYYYFRHAKDKHTLVLSDDVKGYSPCDPKTVACVPVAGERSWIQAWEHEYQYAPAQWAQSDYHFKQPAANEPNPQKILLADRMGQRLWEQNDKHVIYDYPGAYNSLSQGQWYTQVRMEEADVRNDVVRGVSDCRHFSPGHVFKPGAHTFKAEEEGDYLITAIDHYSSTLSSYLGVGREDVEYNNSFTCIPAATPFRPERRTLKPRIHGSQTAVVVGPKGKEIHVDKYGRIKVQFFWEPNSRRDAHFSCWVRCAQMIAGKHWGAMFIPRVGQEVVVTFLEGDPDRPLVTGVVYNADQMPPYDPETEPTKSYVKTNSSPDGEGYNEIRFEDKKDKEQVFLHAQRNMDVRVRAASMETVGGDRHLVVGGEKDGKKWGDQKEKVFRDKHLHVGGEQREKIDGRMELHVLGDEGRLEYVEKDNTIRVCGLQTEHFGDQETRVEGVQSVFSKDGYFLLTPDAHVQADKTVFNASKEILLKGPGGFIKIDSSGVTIEGTLVKVNCGMPPPVVDQMNFEMDAPKPVEKDRVKGPDDPAAADRHKTGQKSAPDLPAGPEKDSPHGE